MCCSVAVKHLLLLISIAAIAGSQAPRDEDEYCRNREDAPTYNSSAKTLMDSYNYLQLLPGNGTGSTPIQNAVWNDRSVDEIDANTTVNPTFWQQGAGGICRFQARVCGWKQNGVVVAQDNWLFTQHIDKSVDPARDNYPIEIHVTLKYSLENCRDRFFCKQMFKVYRYITNTQTLPSTIGTGFMNTSNYDLVETLTPKENTITYTSVVTFVLQPGETGFYLALRDEGTCVGVSRILVQRFNCAPFQTGLILYPDSPAPVRGSAPAQVSVLCVSNGAVSNSPTVTCSSDGTWGGVGTPTCGCTPGYEIDLSSRERCDICPEEEYQSLLSSSEQCKPCPGQSSADDVGTAVCKCRDNYLRHPDRPDDPCVRSPSAPRFDLTNPPVLDGTDVSLVWLPSNDTGGADNLYYDVYSAQLNSDVAIFCRKNSDEIGGDCKGGTECSYTITDLDANTPYSILVVAANSATDDPECVEDVTILGSRYLVFIVGTEDAADDSSLSAGAAAGIAFILTLVFTAVITALIVITIVYCVLRSRSSPKASGKSYSVTTTTTTTTIDLERIKAYSPPPKQSDGSKGPPVKKPGRPVAPPHKPLAPQRPTPPSRPAHNPSPHDYNARAYSPHNGY